MNDSPNHDQVRARNALDALGKHANLRGKQGGDALSGFPSLIVNNGLMATLAFAKRQGEGYAAIGDAIAEHMGCPEVDLLGKSAKTLDGLLTMLTKESSCQLRLVTAEALAYLNYLRRFHKAEKHT